MKCRIALVVFASLLAQEGRAVPTTMTYAGSLKNGGVAVDGTVDVTFTIFDAQSGGVAQYTETQNGLVIVDGELITDIGQNALDDAVLDLAELWLEVEVDGFTMSPRVRLNSVPYALRAEAALRAEEALTLGGLTALDVVTEQELQGLGLADGIRAGTSIVISGGTISVAVNSVGSSELTDDGVTSADLRGQEIVVFLQNVACVSGNFLTVVPTCVPLSCGAGNSLVCGTTGCAPTTGVPCTNTPLGKLLALGN